MLRKLSTELIEHGDDLLKLTTYFQTQVEHNR
jgi:hypothetical protein